MATWSGIRKKLEEEYLAQSLRGRVRYFCTTYRKSHDREGRAAILVDGKEILQGNYYNLWLKWDMLPHDKPISPWQAFLKPNAMTLEEGIFDERTFYVAFGEFDNQSIEASLESENLLVRIFAVLDRRVGKRRLAALWETLSREESVLRDFYLLRLDAEGLNPGKVFPENES